MPALTLRTLGAATAATAALSGLSFLATAPAHAESGSLDYTCTATLVPADLPAGELSDTARKAIEKARGGDTSALKALEALADELPFEEIPDLAVTAVFDSAIGDDAVVPVGSTVELSPLTTTITFPAATVTAALADIDLPTAQALALLDAGIEEDGQSREAIFDFDKFGGGDGSFTATGTGEAESFKAAKAGAYTYAAGDLLAFVGDPEGPFTSFECTPAEDQDLTIDQVTAQAATTTPTPTPSGPVRPDVVQTDAAQPTSPTWLPLAAAGAGSILILGAASQVARRRGTRR
ncbi:hypothetical protein JNB_09439 [Janibacter sp. HTCC2649]|uniref:hypothetical protein n=1 Tax=Janibacter sp. HTCC2649 TaxID=313589 RepID=UPI0000670CB6|nr:hypothetical protein [Janibacter sp. HTCC2649]EAQ00385.1 hypothetical protein JNB_09439 [Janibacter sp. HTCC2649]